ncbi:hypothetical protein U1Q18_019344 [Sarracenia purpurea var. burkii]
MFLHPGCGNQNPNRGAGVAGGEAGCRRAQLGFLELAFVADRRKLRRPAQPRCGIRIGAVGTRCVWKKSVLEKSCRKRRGIAKVIQRHLLRPDPNEEETSGGGSAVRAQKVFGFFQRFRRPLRRNEGIEIASVEKSVTCAKRKKIWLQGLAEEKNARRSEKISVQATVRNQRRKRVESLIAGGGFLPIEEITEKYSAY